MKIAMSIMSVISFVICIASPILGIPATDWLIMGFGFGIWAELLE